MLAKDQKQPHRSFKKGIDADDARRRREEVSIVIRKSKREDQIMKRRMRNDGVVLQKLESGISDKIRTELVDKLKVLYTMLNSDDTLKQVDSVTQLRKLLSIERNPPIQEVIDTGAVPRLIQFLTFHHNHTLQFEAAWALTNIASGSTKHTKVVTDSGAVPLFVQLLRSPNEDVREQAVWALGNIAGDGATYRDLVLKAGAMEPLLVLCTTNSKLTMLRNATWALSNFCRGKPQPPFEWVSGALPTLSALVYYKDDEVLTDACWALSYLSDDTEPHNQRIQAVIQSGVCRRVVELLMHKSPNVKTPALRTVGNIVTGDDVQTQVIMQCSALPCLASLLLNPKKGIRKEACWTISNITAGNAAQIQAVIEANIVPPLVAILRSAEFDIQKEAAWAISNATSGGTDEHIRYMVNQGVISPLCSLFNCTDPKIILVAMEAIENILRVGKKDSSKHGGANRFSEFVEEVGGIDALEALQCHDNEEIYEKAVQMLKGYFESEEEEELPVCTNSVPFSFAFGENSQQNGDKYKFDA